MSGLHEQIKADLGYLKLDAAAGCFAALAEEARTQGWTHIEFLTPRRHAGHSRPRPAPRSTDALCEAPVPPAHRRLRLPAHS